MTRISRVESIEDKLLASLTEKFGGTPELSDGLAFIGVDSVGMAELTVEIEKDFGIRVKDDIVGVDTVQELADYIRERLAASPTPPHDSTT
jgi:acyl carrier protein